MECCNTKNSERCCKDLDKEEFYGKSKKLKGGNKK